MPRRGDKFAFLLLLSAWAPLVPLPSCFAYQKVRVQGVDCMFNSCRISCLNHAVSVRFLFHGGKRDEPGRAWSETCPDWTSCLEFKVGLPVNHRCQSRSSTFCLLWQVRNRFGQIKSNLWHLTWSIWVGLYLETKQSNKNTDFEFFKPFCWASKIIFYSCSSGSLRSWMCWNFFVFAFVTLDTFMFMPIKAML